MWTRRTLLLTLAVSTWARGGTAQAPAEVAVESGRLLGVRHGAVVAYLGIPFAAPPVNDLRWRPPQPPQPWQGVRHADAFGHDCMQLPAPSEAAPPSTASPAEDCLFANVWTPAASQTRRLPVMVWIYGGGFVNGGSSPAVYDGAAFARDGVVFVSFNYRLGRFGFFAHPGLTAEGGAELGNYAYMDQLAALRWVQRNIAAFGGDPARVTIFGESAGGSSVQMLLTSPAADGLFAQAVVQSGGGRDGGAPRHVRQAETPKGAPPSGEILGLQFAKANGIEGDGADAVAKLRQLPPAALVANLNILTRRVDPSLNATFPGPMLDGRIVAEPVEAAYRAGHAKRVPLIIGANDNDLAYPSGNTIDALLAPFGPQQREARAAYDPKNTGSVHDVGLKVAADRAMMEPARFVARLLSSQGHTVFLYRFAYVATSMRSEWPGATHASEVPYVFETVRARYGSATSPEDERVAHEVHAFWVGFAKHGVPQATGQPAWPAFRADDNRLPSFTGQGLILGPDPFKARLDLTEAARNRKHQP
jgi:para-nitrobenzyl esterase